jgi:hypothetical protein
MRVEHVHDRCRVAGSAGVFLSVHAPLECGHHAVDPHQWPRGHRHRERQRRQRVDEALCAQGLLGEGVGEADAHRDIRAEGHDVDRTVVDPLSIRGA